MIYGIFTERERCYTKDYFAEYGKEREIELTVVDLFKHRPESVKII